VTWGKLQAVTPAFMAAKYSDGTPYVEEAHAELAFDWVRANGTASDNLNLTQLAADLSSIVEPPAPTPKRGTNKQQLAQLLTNVIQADLKSTTSTEASMKADVQRVLNAH
jgi:hypothetical protein